MNSGVVLLAFAERPRADIAGDVSGRNALKQTQRSVFLAAVPSKTAGSGHGGQPASLLP
jgi:hypothetical protein